MSSPLLKITYYIGLFIGRLIVNPYRAIIFPSLVLVTTASTYISYLFFKRRLSRKRIRQIVKDLLQAREIKIESFFKEHKYEIFKIKDKLPDIVNLSGHTLIKLIKSHKLSIKEVLIAHIIQSKNFGHKYNLTSEVNYNEAYKQADELEKKEQDQPLIGLPLVVNDRIEIKFLNTTLGYIHCRENINPEDSYIIRVLKSKGAIPYLKSNTSEGTLSLNVENKIWGKADYTHVVKYSKLKNKDFSLGFSCDSALILNHCSPLAIGLDIFGETRISACLSDLFAFKPTGRRVSKIGFTSFSGELSSNNNIITESVGFIGKNIDDILLISKNLFGEFKEDYEINNLPFDELKYKNNNQYKIGICLDYFLCETAKETKTLILELVNKLKEIRGYECVEYSMNNFQEMIELHHLLFCNSELDGVYENYKRDVPEYYLYDIFGKRFGFRTTNLKEKFKNLFKDKFRKNIFDRRFQKIHRKDFFKLTKKYIKLKFEFYKYLKSLHINALITPVLPVPIITNKITNNFPFDHFTLIFNCADMPTGVVPIKTKSYKINYESRYTDDFTEGLKEGTENLYFNHFCVQIATMPFNDENCLRLMKEIDELNNL